MRKNFLTTLLFTGIIAITTMSLAEKPPWAKNDKNSNKHEQSDKYQRHDDYDQRADDRNRNQSKEYYNRQSYSQDRYGNDRKRTSHFRDEHRYVINNYYMERYRNGHCPPGLVRKNNGCRPPGHARNWQLGRQLPREVIFYDIPPTVYVMLGPPPPHHRYVRVAIDILLITIGTGMVVDALLDLNDN